MPNPTLLPCPLCGCSPRIKHLENTGGIVCPENSPCHGSGLCFLFLPQNEESAIAAWNRRAAPAGAQGVVAWMLRRKSDGFIRSAYQSKPSDEQLQIAAMDGDEYVPLYDHPQPATGDAALKSELDAARTNYGNIRDAIGSDYMDSHAGAVEQARRQAKDAARYRWLCENRKVTLLTALFGNGCVNRTIAEADATIDAALGVGK